MKVYGWLLIGLLLWSCGDGKNASQQSTAPKQSESGSDTVVSETSGEKIIMFFGNSITAGYGLDPEQAFPAIIQQYLDSLGYNYKVINAGSSGETSRGGLNRIDWVLQTVPDIFVLELGANDGLRGLDLGKTEQNLIEIIEKVRKKNPDVEILLAGMEVPPNLGESYTREFREMYRNIAQEKGVKLIPFILDDVAGIPELNLADGIHPTEEGHVIVAGNVWSELESMLKKDTDS